MKIRYLAFSIAAITTILLSGCATAPDHRPDSVKILEVKSAPISGGEHTSYKVKVSYSLGSKPKGKVLLGFNSEDPRHFKMVADASVERGSGEVELVADVKRPKRSVLTVYVNLSEDPHPYQWTPLANDTRQVRIMQ